MHHATHPQIYAILCRIAENLGWKSRMAMITKDSAARYQLLSALGFEPQIS
jgi:L-amino acid N-acyltransferase YncA